MTKPLTYLVTINQTGIILISTLVFVALLTLLVFASMDTAIIETKMSQNYHNQMQAFEAAEAGLKQAEQAILNSQAEACMIQATVPSDLTKQSLNWWQHYCKGKFPEAQLYYFIQKLNDTSCQLLQENKFFIVEYYSLYSYGLAVAGSVPSILQETFAFSTAIPCAKADNNKLTIGKLSWRELK